jgi:hypothetical protein
MAITRSASANRRSARNSSRESPAIPRGRPKGRKGLSALLQAELQTPIKVTTEEGKTKRMTKLQAIVKRLVNALLKGDPKALALFTRIHPDEERESSAAETSLSDREKQLVNDFMCANSRRRRR